MSPGSILANGSELYCQNIHSVGNVGGALAAVRKPTRFGRTDLIIAIAFPRYLNDTVKLATLAKRRGVKVIAITDRPSSPLVELADIALYVHAERQFAATSDASVLSVIEAVSRLCVTRNSGASETCLSVAATLQRGRRPMMGHFEPG